MALSIKTDEADRLARQLSGLTGETMTEAVTRALQERLDRLQAERRSRKEDLASALMAKAAEMRDRYDIRPVSKDEWDAAWGED